VSRHFQHKCWRKGCGLVEKSAHGAHVCVQDAGPSYRRLSRFRYRGTLHRSLSGAASAAAEHLGIKGRVNGFIFWGLVKTTRPNAGEYLRKLAHRYEEQAATLLKQAGEGIKGEVPRDLEAHASRLTELLTTAAA
jgi:hypothetical protein